MSDTPWTAFLDQAGAVRDEDGTLLHVGRPPQPKPGMQLAIADHLRLITLRGPDAATFLQGQVTADVREVSAGQSRLAMHLSLKGRGLVSLRILPAEDGFDLLVPAPMADTLRKLLGKYIVFSKATLAADDQRIVLALHDPSAGTLSAGTLSATLADAGLPLPEQGQVALAGARTVARLDAQRSVLLLPADDAIALWPSLAQGRDIGGSEHALLSDILAGEGSVLPGAEDLFLPQALNYDVLHGVSFRKGCYTGQEVVARMHFKGQMKQRLQHISWPGDEPLPPGTVLRDASGKALGELVQSVTSGGRVQALAVLRLDHEGELYLQQTDTAQITALGTQYESLPYSLPER